MNEDTVSLLKECNSGCKSATSSMEQVLGYVKNEKLAALIKKYDEKHIKAGDECHELLNKMNQKEKDPSKVAMMFAELGTDMKLMLEQSAHKAADLLIDGCTMGIKSLSEYINKYRNADEKVVNLTRKLIKIEQDFMTELLEFL